MAEMDNLDISALIASMVAHIKQDCDVASLRILGIHRGGAWVAQALHQALASPHALGFLDIAFYRDDFSQIGLHPEVRASDIPYALDNQHVLLVDDVIQTGRTIRAALNEIFDYGRPAKVTLACLIERGGAELPIRADVVGKRLALASSQRIKLQGPAPLQLTVTEVEQ